MTLQILLTIVICLALALQILPKIGRALRHFLMWLVRQD